MDSEVRHRRSIRLPGYDYAGAGAYFVTICTYPVGARCDVPGCDVPNGGVPGYEAYKKTESEFYGVNSKGRGTEINRVRGYILGD